MLRPVNKMQPSQSNWNFPDFPPVPLSKPELFKLTMITENWNELPYSTTDMPISTLIEKIYIFSHAYRVSIVTFLAWRYNSRETTGSPSSKYEHRRQRALLRNFRNIRVCKGKKIIVSVTYESERISIKNSLPNLKCVLRGPRADLWQFYGFLRKPFSLPWTTQKRRNTHFK